ncbi:MAG TPA: hypothetical protein DDX06_15215 [Curvibacter sp.]|nr:hypothetical protein [Curvibacter sp.]
MLCGFSGGAFAQSEGYVCIAEKAVGFKFDNSSRKWASANFDVSSSRYLLSKGASGWEWKSFGEKSGSDCSGNFTEFNVIRCEGIFDQVVVMNRETLRYQLIYGIASTIRNTKGDTPFIEVGTCAKM